jgi:hypothetical protein
MERPFIARRIVQGVAVCYGIFGILLLGGGVYFVIFVDENKELISKIIIISAFAFPGSIILFSSIQNIFRFGEKSIKSISAVITLSLSFFYINWSEILLERVSDLLPTRLYEGITILLPLVIAFIIYAFLVKIIVKITHRLPVKPKRSPTIDDDLTVAL